jgi:hypothetical protein
VILSEAPVPTHYEVLGVAPDADAESIRRAYVAVAKASHPDRRQDDDEGRRARAEDRIRAANAAWHVLRDPGRRAEYDRSLRGASSTRSSSARATGPAGAGGGTVRRPPPSGVVVPAAHATLWRYAPIVVILVVLVGLLVVSAYATSTDTSAPSDTLSRTSPPEVGACVLVAFLSNARVPVPADCGTQGAFRVYSWVDTPRPCPPATESLPFSDGKTTLCLLPVR